MVNVRTFFTLALAPLLAFGATARADDTLDALVDRALAANQMLHAAQRKWEAAAARVQAERSLPDPMIGADVERDHTRFGDYMDVEYMVSQALPWFGQRSARAGAAAWKAEAEGYRYLEQIRTVRADTQAAAWDLWLADRAIEVQETSARLMRDFLEGAQARYVAGSAMQADVLRAQIELDRMTNELASLRAERAVAQSALNTLLNEAPTTERAVADPPPPGPLEQALDHHLRRARDFCCLLLSFEREVKAARTQVRAAKLERTPMLELRVEGRQFEGRSGIDEYDTGVFLNVPWLWRGKYGAMIREAGAMLAMAEADLQNEINMTEQDVHESFTQSQNAWRTFALYEHSVVPQSRQLVEVTLAAYQTGGASFLELAEARQQLQQALLTRHRALADHAKAVAKLDQITGPYGEAELATGLVTVDNNPPPEYAP